MGFLRGAGIVVAGVLLFVFLLCSGIFLTLGLSMTYDNVNPKITSIATAIVEEQIGTEQIENYLPLMQAYCKQNTEYVFSEQGYIFQISCDNIPNSSAELISKAVSQLVQDFYYKEYSCEFWDCFRESDTPLFLISQHAQKYWVGKFYTSLIISMILTAGIILLSRKKANGILLSGLLIFVSSLIISKLKTIGTKIAEAMISPVAGALSGEDSQEILSDVVGVFFSESSKVFIWMFVIGLILIAGGIVLRLMGIGFKIEEKIERAKEKFSKEAVQEIVREEISKEKGKKKRK